MKTEDKRAALQKIVNKYPRRESAILPALYFMQQHNHNMLSEQDIKAVAEIAGVSVSHTFGVATYHTLFNKKPVGRYHPYWLQKLDGDRLMKFIDNDIFGSDHCPVGVDLD